MPLSPQGHNISFLSRKNFQCPLSYHAIVVCLLFSPDIILLTINFIDMKKYLTVLLCAAVTILAFSSCKKDCKPECNPAIIASGESDLSAPRYGLAAAGLSNKILFAGGVFEVNTSYSNVVDIYDVNTGTWSTAALSQARYSLAAAAAGNKIFVCRRLPWRRFIRNQYG